jgi:hypothetical protein
LEHGLRDVLHRGGQRILTWLLSLPGLRVPGDVRRPGERCMPKQVRTIHSLFGEIRVARTYYHHAVDAVGRYPLDEALGLIDGHTPGLASLITRSAAEHPFGHAAESFHAYTGLTVDSRQFPRMSAYVGPMAERFLRAGLPTQEPTPPRLYVAADGTGAPLRHTELKGRKGRQPDGSAQTHEIKVGCVFTQHSGKGQKPWRDLDSTTYVATPQRSEAFASMLRAEARRRFPGLAKTVVFLADGAAWLWELQRIHFPNAIGIVDFYHAAEHVAKVLDLVEDRHSRAGRKRRRRWTKLLLRDKLDQFLIEARAAFPPGKRAEGDQALAYFEKNRHRMRYGTFRSMGYFIGSGVVEAACKTIVAQRFKASGMHWSLPGLSHVLSLRTALLSHRYNEFWTHLPTFRSAA